MDTGKFKTGDNSMIRAVSHELTHFIKAWSPKQYSVLQEIVLSNYTAEELENAIAHQQSKDKSLSREEAIEEVVCDSCETMFKDNADLMKRISQKSPKLAEKIKSWLDKIITNLKKVLDELNPKSQEAKIIERNMNAFKEVQKQWNSALISATVNSNSVSEDFKVKNAEATLLSSRENNEILNLVKKVKKGDYKSNEKVYLGNVSVDVATRIKQLTNIDVTDFKVAIEARQINHILKDHGENGKTDHSMSDNNIAKIEFALTDPTYISKGGRTQAYSYMKNGKNKTAETVIYEKETGEKSFYVVQAIPDTKAKTLYVVTAFIGKKGYKKETSQLINAKSPNATPKSGSVVVSTDNISQNDNVVNSSISENSKNDTKYSIDDTKQSARDNEYIKAVKNGDTDKAQEMVEQSAMKWGAYSKDGKTPLELYHGTKSFGFTEFDLNRMDDKRSIFLTSSKEIASTYSGTETKNHITDGKTDNVNIKKLSRKELANYLNQNKIFLDKSWQSSEFRFFGTDEYQEIKTKTEKNKKAILEKLESVNVSENTNDSSGYNRVFGYTEEFKKQLKNSNAQLSDFLFDKIIDTEISDYYEKNNIIREKELIEFATDTMITDYLAENERGLKTGKILAVEPHVGITLTAGVDNISRKKAETLVSRLIKKATTHFMLNLKIHLL